MKHVSLLAARACGLAMLSAAAAVAQAWGSPNAPQHSNDRATVQMPSFTDKAMELRSAMRQLWGEHVLWTRYFIISAADDLPDKDANAARLLQNQVDIGNAIRPYYGDAAGDKLTALLKEHILVAADLVGAAKAGDSAKVETTKAKWYSNSDEIADFLSAANPRNWPRDAMRAHMRDHLNLTFEEASSRLQENYSADYAAFAKVTEQIMEMADELSEGIIKQFPHRFQ